MLFAVRLCLNRAGSLCDAGGVEPEPFELGEARANIMCHTLCNVGVEILAV